MVLLFSGRNNPREKEIIEILCSYGGDYISDKTIRHEKGLFTVISEYKKTELKIKNGIALILDDTERFNGQIFPQGIIGICEDTNITAKKLFEKSNIPVISCGMNQKNTVTFSSLNQDYLLVALQRTVTDTSGKDIEPGEYQIRLKKAYQPFSVMASAAVLLLCGIIPREF